MNQNALQDYLTRAILEADACRQSLANNISANLHVCLLNLPRIEGMATSLILGQLAVALSNRLDDDTGPDPSIPVRGFLHDLQEDMLHDSRSTNPITNVLSDHHRIARAQMIRFLRTILET